MSDLGSTVVLEYSLELGWSVMNVELEYSLELGWSMMNV